MLTLFLAASLASADPLLADSFETGDAVPDGWYEGPAVPGVTYRYDRRRGSDGSRSLSLKKTANRYFPVAGWARAVDTGGVSRVRVSAQVKAERATKAVIDVQFLDAAGKVVSKSWAGYIGAKNTGDPPVTHDWKEYGDTFDVPPEAKQIGIVLQIYGPGEVWFDNVRVESAGRATAGSATSGGATASAGGDQSTDRAEVLEVAVGEGRARYILHGADGLAGRPIVVVLPGGDGSAEFAPFVSAIQSTALKGEAVVAQMVAPGRVVWPTRVSQSAAPPAEEAIAAVIADAARRSSGDASKAVALAWSSGGPPAWATLLADGSPLSGAVVAMSVFKPDRLPPLSAASGKRVAILHSPEDKVCPIRMARDAEQKLTAAGATVTFTEYPGGHGWRGNVHKMIGEAVRSVLE